jgi:molybdopterin molybdotransferase
MFEIDQALGIVLAQCRALPTVVVALSDTLFRTLATAIATDIDQPPFDRSVMDGYAVRAADTTHPPVDLRVVGQIAAGASPQGRLAPGQAMQINTGAPIPGGADAIVRVERTRLDSGSGVVTILEAVQPGQLITPRGKYKKAGDVVLPAGSLLTPVNIGVCASAGAAEVVAYRQPRVAIIVTGNELVDVGERPVGGQIRNSNQYVLESLIRSVHCEPAVQSVARDERTAISDAISKAADCDVICVTGGVSMGAFDFVPDVLIALGATVHFHRISIKPGRPTLFATLPNGQLVFALPGNPVSALVGFRLLVAPALAALQGRLELPPLLQAELRGTLPAEGPRRAYYPASLSVDGNGGYVAHLLSWHGSGDALGMAGAQAFIVRPPGSPPAKTGEAVQFIPLD